MPFLSTRNLDPSTCKDFFRSINAELPCVVQKELLSMAHVCPPRQGKERDREKTQVATWIVGPNQGT